MAFPKNAFLHYLVMGILFEFENTKSNVCYHIMFFQNIIETMSDGNHARQGLCQTVTMSAGTRKRQNQEFFAEPEPNRTSDFFCRTEPKPNRTFVHMNYDLRSYQLKLIKMLAELVNLNHCAVPFLSRSAVNLSLYNNSPVMK